MYYEYAGMSYEQASRAAERLIKTRGWYNSIDRLRALQEIMKRESIVDVVAADPGKSGLAMAKLVHPRADIIVQRTRPA